MVGSDHKKVCRKVHGFKARIGDLHMCAPDSIRSAGCLLGDCPDGGHANEQLKFPDRNAMIQSENLLQYSQYLNENPSAAR